MFWPMAMDEAPRISPRVSAKSLPSASLSMSSSSAEIWVCFVFLKCLLLFLRLTMNEHSQIKLEKEIPSCCLGSCFNDTNVHVNDNVASCNQACRCLHERCGGQRNRTYHQKNCHWGPTQNPNTGDLHALVAGITPRKSLSMNTTSLQMASWGAQVLSCFYSVNVRKQ